MKFDTQIKQLIAANKDNHEAKQAIRDALHLVELHIYDILKKHQSKRPHPLPSA